jgi:AbrB family looped-hinge helix DNA binding protein
MTTVLSPEGQLVLPASVRRKLRLSPGDDFEVLIEDEETIMLRRISKQANRGLVDLLLARPAPFEVPPRESDDSQPPEL